jgi:hypothetical protein
LLSRGERDVEIPRFRIEHASTETSRPTAVGANELKVTAIPGFDGGLERLRSASEKVTDARISNRAVLENERLGAQATVYGAEQHGHAKTVGTAPADSP